MRRFLTRILICLVPTLISLGVVGWAYHQYDNGKGGFTLGVDLVGGTILVYEVDLNKTDPSALPKVDELAAALKRRIDPADLYNITIRPMPTNPPRVEIVLPTGGKHQIEAEQRNWTKLLEDAAKEYPVPGDPEPYKDVHRNDIPGLIDAIVAKNPDLKEKRSEIDEWVRKRTDQGGDKERRLLTGDEVERIKNLIAKQGRLEFRILANGKDDTAAISAAMENFKSEEAKRELEKLEIQAKPPPPPRREGSTTFPVNLPAEQDHSYSWVEVGKTQLWSVGLNSEALEANPARKAQVEEVLRTGIPSPLGTTTGNLFFVRKITDWSRRIIKDRNQGKSLEYFVLVRNPLKGQEITGDYLVRAAPGHDQRGKLSIEFTFSPEGGNRFWDVTSRNRPDRGSEETSFKRQLAIIFDEQVMSAPALQSAIRTNGQITGEFTQQEVNDMVRILRAGALPATLKKDPVSENSMGPTLGADTIVKGALSVFGAFLAVMAFMVFYYRFAGFVACVALFCNLLLTVAFMVMVQAAFTLPGLAGLVLTLGMAVDANVLIYERLREERERGASLALALRNGYDRAFPTIIDTHLSSIFTAIVLYVVGNDQLKGFGISLTVGLIISLFTSLYMTRTMFEIWFFKGWVKDFNFYGGLVRLLHSKFWDFMAIRYYFFTATVALTVVGAALFIWRSDPKSPNTVLNIDFTGGVAFTGQLAPPESESDKISLEKLRATLEDHELLPDMSLEQLSVGSGETFSTDSVRFFTVRTSNKNADQVLRHISEKLGDRLKKILLKEPIVKAGVSLTAVDSPDLAMVAPSAAWAWAGPRQTVVDLALAGWMARTPIVALEAKLEFTNEKGEVDYASPGQLHRLLLANDRLKEGSFEILRPESRDKEKEGRYSELTIRMNDPVAVPTLQAALKEVRAAFNEKPQPERLEVFDSQLAANTQQRALYAILASWAAVLLYLWFRFGNWTFGTATVLCLIHDLFFTLGVIACCHYIYVWFGPVLGIQDFKIDLPSVAALLTLVGYSVSDTIVVFDRIREIRGKNPALTPQMINEGVNQTLTRTILASATVFIVVLVLYIFGGEGVKLFAFVMIVGVIVGTYSSIYIAAPLLLMFGEGRAPAGELDRASQKVTTSE